MTTAQNIQISSTVERYQHNGRMTAGYVVRNHNGTPVFVGTFSECAERVGAVYGTIRDARGMQVSSAA